MNQKQNLRREKWRVIKGGLKKKEKLQPTMKIVHKQSNLRRDYQKLLNEVHDFLQPKL